MALKDDIKVLQDDFQELSDDVTFLKDRVEDYDNNEFNQLGCDHQDLSKFVYELDARLEELETKFKQWDDFKFNLKRIAEKQLEIFKSLRDENNRHIDLKGLKELVQYTF